MTCFAWNEVKELAGLWFPVSSCSCNPGWCWNFSLQFTYLWLGRFRLQLHLLLILPFEHPSPIQYKSTACLQVCWRAACPISILWGQEVRAQQLRQELLSSEPVLGVQVLINRLCVLRDSQAVLKQNGRTKGNIGYFMKSFLIGSLHRD